MTHYLGLDLGTSSLKALLVRHDGTVVETAHGAYRTRRGSEAEAEQDPADWLAAVAAVVRLLVPAGRVDGVAVVGHTPSIVLADRDRAATHPALTWQDTRPAAEAEELAAALGDAAPHVGGGLPWNPAYLPAKLLYLARHAAQAVRRARWLLQPKDFIGYALTGRAATDIWSAKGLCRIDDGAAVRPVFELANTPIDKLPARQAPWEPVGRVDHAGSAWSGLAAGTLVATGWSDALAGMLAVGAFGTPTPFILTGTSDIAGVSGETLGEPDTVLHVPTSCAPLPVSYGPSQTSGASVQWLSEVLRTPVDDVLVAAQDADEAAVPRFLPYLSGERAPLWRPDLRGAFSQLSRRTARPELARAVLRGVSLSNRHVLTAAGDTGGPVHIGGRNGQHPAWVQARLETLGRPLVLHAQPETAALGAAMIAASAAERTAVAAVAERLCGPTRVMHPDERDVARGARLFEDYRAEVAALLDRLEAV